MKPEHQHPAPAQDKAFATSGQSVGSNDGSVYRTPFLVSRSPIPYYNIQASAWCESRRRRAFEFCAAALVTAAISPALLLIACAVRLNSDGPAIFRQKRVGWRGNEFTILKFRTMVADSSGSRRSSAHDPRITSVGRVLRRYKLDELPQLINVLRGDMSLIGPRPKLDGHHSIDIHFRPGLTGAATLAFASEESLLRHVPAHHLEECHRQLITPRKLELDLHYMARATFRSDLFLLWKTLRRAERYSHLNQVGNWQPPHTPASRPTAAVYPLADGHRRVAGTRQQARATTTP